MTESTLVLGATGTVGSALVGELERRGVAVRAATRAPERAVRRGLGGAGTRWVYLDLERPETFAGALDGADRVFLVARPGDDEADRVARPLVAEMARRGVRHVVNLSAMGAEQRNDFALRRVELALEEAGLGFTHLRPNFFFQVFSTDPLLTAIRAAGVLAVPAGDARLSFVDARDVAAVAAVALMEPGHVGRAYTLTGGEAVDHAQVARALSRVAGATVRYDALDEPRTRAQLAAAGFSEARRERLLGFYGLVRAGWCAPVSPDVERVLGRPPLTLARFAADYAGCWRAGEARSPHPA